MKHLQIPVTSLVRTNMVTVDVNAPLTEVCELMASTMRDVVVVVDAGRACGLVTGFSIATRVGEAGTADLEVGDAMIPGPPAIDINTPLSQALTHMRKRHMPHLAVTNNGQIAGTLSAADVAYMNEAPDLKKKLR